MKMKIIKMFAKKKKQDISGVFERTLLFKCIKATIKGQLWLLQRNLELFVY